MSDFTPIQTQEEFDEAIKERLARKDKEAAEKYKEYMSPNKVAELKADYERKISEVSESVKDFEAKLKEKDDTVSQLTKRAESAEASLLKNEIAYKNNLPLELAGRLVGSTAEELTKDAETLAGFMAPKTAPPLYTGGQGGSSGTNGNAAMMGLLSQLKDSMNT